MKMKSYSWLMVTLLFLALQPPHVSAQGILFYPRTDGSVVGVDVARSNVVKTVSAGAFVGATPGAGRNVAFDPVTRLLWYSATDGQIHSANVDTLQAGPE